ncbi:phasin family protein [Paenibacillus thermotolerans]|uniref:phasin family protein n=1 Tax=Paenibacillus thermotolerans TaxID=3027807 RepID=UPI0023688339|nr:MULTISPECIES: hypothetical protein [unclassified Paenibacillus]
MKDTITKAVSLGLGIVMAGKEQVEKTVEELVKKGEVSRTESKAFAEELIKKGDETRKQIEDIAGERVQAVLSGLHFATKEDIERLERRLEASERSRSINPES